ncbi:MAG: rhodanese-like domain-containing protein [Cyclobacteriaceae bacterium]|nr:rhodanese-like domain-containing protein [Cyclobacteriaceae bacterium]
MEDITAQELKKRNPSETLNVVDVREEWEHQENNLGGANIPLASLPHRLEELDDYKDQELILYCRTGNRSGQAQRYLQQQGFTQVRNLLGGIEEYQQQAD